MDTNKLLKLGTETAELLQDAEVAEYVAFHMGAPDNGQMNILLLGEPNQDIMKIAGKLIPEFPVAEAKSTHSYQIQVRYSESTAYQWVDPMGDCRIVSREVFLEKLAEEAAMFRGEIVLNSEQLKDKNLSIVASAEDYKDIPMEELLMHSDYCFFTMFAPMFLSIHERRIMQNYLKPYMQGYLSVLVSKSDLLTDEDFAQVQDAAGKYFKDEIPVHYIPNKDMEKVCEKFVGLANALPEARAACVERYGKLYAAFLAKHINTAMNALSLENNAIDKVIESLDAASKQLSQRTEKAVRSARLEYLNSVEEECRDTFFQFHDSMKEKLSQEIEKCDDITKLQTMLPRYIEDMWNKQLDEIYAYISRNLDLVKPYLEQYIVKDVNKLLTDSISSDLSNVIVKITNDYTSRKNGVKAGSLAFEEKKNRANLMRGGTIAAGAAMLLMSHPITGLVAIAASQYVYKTENQKFISESKLDLTAAAHKKNDEIYENALQKIRSAMTNNEKTLTAGVKTCYDSIMQDIMLALQDKRANRGLNEGVLEALQKLNNELTT